MSYKTHEPPMQYPYKQLLLLSLFFILSPLNGYTVKKNNLTKFKPSQRTVEQVFCSKALVAISFHYVESRLQYLGQVLTHLSTLPNVHIIIVTNTIQKKEIDSIQELFDLYLIGQPGISSDVQSYPNLDHPFHLTWCHKELITNVFLGKKSNYTHFIYLEDDITFNFENLCYFLEYRDKLKSKGLIPSFLRIERKKDGSGYYNTDNPSPINIDKQPHIPLKNVILVNPASPYMACFVLDVELAQEYVKSKSFDREKSTFCEWEVRERAAMGLCFENIPLGFNSRYVVGVTRSNLQVPRAAWVYHLPNNYTDNPYTSFGKVSIDSLFYEES